MTVLYGSENPRIAYFSMEIGLTNALPTYSGGLGVLAGDTIRSAADLQVPVVAVSLIHRKGYFFQRLTEEGSQVSDAVAWEPGEMLQELPERVSVAIAGKNVMLRAWRYDVRGIDGYSVPVFFLDTDLPENESAHRTLTDHLYGGDLQYRLCQEVILGIGGVRMLRELGYRSIERYHMNEGHSSLLTVELMDELSGRGREKSPIPDTVLDAVRRQCIFTTHTPVPAGHDQFPRHLAEDILSDHQSFLHTHELFQKDGVLNMTYLALRTSRYVNGVAKKHGEVSRLMYADYEIDAITNGVHTATWASPPMRDLFDRYVPGWKQDPFSLRAALSIPKGEVWAAHSTAKHDLIRRINQDTGARLLPDVFTMGFARRSTPYKRADLLFHDVERLKQIVSLRGPVQILYAGKAHPRDEGGIELIRKVVGIGKALRNTIPVLYLENYDISLAQLLIAGVDLWLNTPQPPLEASGTSGMKAAVNGVPSLSILDGWWIEGHVEGVTGWAIEHGDSSQRDADSLYRKLEQTILPVFYGSREQYQCIMRNCIALNGSFFSTHRMLQEYVLKAYFR